MSRCETRDRLFEAWIACRRASEFMKGWASKHRWSKGISGFELNDNDNCAPRLCGNIAVGVVA
jgi:hypothetical protein